MSHYCFCPCCHLAAHRIDGGTLLDVERLRPFSRLHSIGIAPWMLPGTGFDTRRLRSYASYGWSGHLGRDTERDPFHRHRNRCHRMRCRTVPVPAAIHLPAKTRARLHSFPYSLFLSLSVTQRATHTSHYLRHHVYPFRTKQQACKQRFNWLALTTVKLFCANLCRPCASGTMLSTLPYPRPSPAIHPPPLWRTGPTSGAGKGLLLGLINCITCVARPFWIRVITGRSSFWCIVRWGQ